MKQDNTTIRARRPLRSQGPPVSAAKGTVQGPSAKRRILYAKAVFGDDERRAVSETLKESFLSSGPLVTLFEERVATLFGKQFGVATNSGSSANLLALSGLRLPKGGEIITPAMTFNTTVAPIVQNGYVPVFIDSEIGNYVPTARSVLNAVTERTVAIMLPQLAGSIGDVKEMRTIADQFGIKLIDDSCDTLAPTLYGRTVASYCDITTTSFYGSHIITCCGMGGMVLTDERSTRDTLVALRDWGRVGNDSEAFEDRFNFEVDGIPYDSKFVYSGLGYNFKLIDPAAAFGLVQLNQLPTFVDRRNENFQSLLRFFRSYEHFFHLPYVRDGATTTWIAFPLTVRQDAPFKRLEFLRHLEGRGVQTRVFFSGNVTRHPCFADVRYRVHGTLHNADTVMAGGFLIGCHHGLADEDMEYLCGVCDDFLKGYN